jgi:hypothetical protein
VAANIVVVLPVGDQEVNLQTYFDGNITVYIKADNFKFGQTEASTHLCALFSSSRPCVRANTFAMHSMEYCNSAD